MAQVGIVRVDELHYAICPGLPEVRNGYLYPNEQPGLGIELDEQLAAQYPPHENISWWTEARLPDGSPARR